MTTTSTATIETLTATVNVLTMGSRQITTGVYRQLDYMDFDEVEPFGRVRDSKDDVSGGTVYLIGSHKETGALVRSYIEFPDGAHRAPDEYRHWHRHMVTIGKPVTEKVGFKSPSGHELLWNLGEYFRCEHVWHDTTDEARRGDLCDMDGLKAAWQAAAQQEGAWLDEWWQDYRATKALPLIVLASR